MIYKFKKGSSDSEVARNIYTVHGNKVSAKKFQECFSGNLSLKDSLIQLQLSSPN